MVHKPTELRSKIVATELKKLAHFLSHGNKLRTQVCSSKQGVNRNVLCCTCIQLIFHIYAKILHAIQLIEPYLKLQTEEALEAPARDIQIRLIAMLTHFWQQVFGNIANSDNTVKITVFISFSVSLLFPNSLVPFITFHSNTSHHFLPQVLIIYQNHTLQTHCNCSQILVLQTQALKFDINPLHSTYSPFLHLSNYIYLDQLGKISTLLMK